MESQLDEAKAAVIAAVSKASASELQIRDLEARSRAEAADLVAAKKQLEEEKALGLREQLEREKAEAAQALERQGVEHAATLSSLQRQVEETKAKSAQLLEENKAVLERLRTEAAAQKIQATQHASETSRLNAAFAKKAADFANITKDSERLRARKDSTDVTVEALDSERLTKLLAEMQAEQAAKG